MLAIPQIDQVDIEYSCEGLNAIRGFVSSSPYIYRGFARNRLLGVTHPHAVFEEVYELFVGH